MATADFFTPGMAYMTEPGQLVTVFMEGEQVYSIGGLLRIALERREISTRVHGFVHDLKEAEQAAQGADCLVGVPGQMALLAEAAPKLRPKTVLLSGDYVPQSVVRRLESIWECEVFQHWGMTETGYGGGVECGAHCGYHLRDADLMIEIIHPETGESVPNGTWGKLYSLRLPARACRFSTTGPAILAVSVRMRAAAEVFCRAWIKLWGGSRIPFSFITETRFPFISWTKSCSRWMAFTIMPRS